MSRPRSRSLRRTFSVLTMVMGLLLTGLGVKVALAEAVWQITVTTITPLPQLSGDAIVVELQFQCAAVDEAECLDSEITIPMPPEVDSAVVASHPYVDASSYAAGVVTIDLADSIPAGSTATIEMTVATENGTTPDGFTWDMVATIDGSNTEPAQATDSASVTAMADIQIQKNLNGANPTPTDTPVKYWIQVCDPSDPGDSGDVWLSTADVIDTLPPGSTYLSASPGGVYDSGTHSVTWSGVTDLGSARCTDNGGQLWVEVEFSSATFGADPGGGLITNVTNFADVTGTAYGDPGTDYVDSTELNHGFGPLGASGTWYKNPSTVFFGNAEYTYPGDTTNALDASDVTYDIRFFNSSVVDVPFTIVDPFPCVSNMYNSNPPGTICADPAFVVEDVTMPHLPAIDTAIAGGWRLEYTTNLGATGVFGAPINEPGDWRWIAPTLPAGELIAELSWPYDPNLTARSGQADTLAEINGHMIEGIPDGTVTNNFATGTAYLGEDPAFTSVISGTVTVVEPQYVLGVAKFRGTGWVAADGGVFGVTLGNGSDVPAPGVIFTDLLPDGFGFNRLDIHEGRNSSDPDLPPSDYQLEVIDDYLGSGRTLVRITFTRPLSVNEEIGIQIHTDPSADIENFPFGTTTNEARGYLETGTLAQCLVLDNSGSYSFTGPTPPLTTEAIDLDGDGTTVDTFCQAEGVTNRTGSFAILESEKEVQGDLDTQFEGFPTVGSSTAGGTGSYRMTLSNQGSLDLDDLVVYDIFPHLGDTGVSATQAATPRGTEWAPVLTGPITAPGSAVVEYSDSTNPCRTEVDPAGPAGCVTDWTTTPDTWTDVAAIRITFPGLTMAPGDVLTLDWDVSIPLSAQPGEVAWNSFAVAASEAVSGDALLATEPPKVGLAVPQTDISVDKTVEGGDDPAAVALGDLIDYSIVVQHDTVIITNPDGSVSYVQRDDNSQPGEPSTALDVELTDVIPAGMSIVAGSSNTSCNGSFGGSFDEATGVWSVGDIAPGEVFELCYQATVAAAGSYTNAVEVTQNSVPDVDSTPSNTAGEDDEDEVTVVVETPAVVLEKLVEDSLGSGVFIEADNDDGDLDQGSYLTGEAVTYQFVVSNPGTLPITDIEVDDPSIAFFCGALTLDTLAGGASHTFTCTWPLGWGAGTTTNTATVTATDDGGNPLTDTDSADVVVTLPLVSIEKATNGVDADIAADAVPVAIGDPITWTYLITNEGTESLVNLVLTDDQEATVSLAEPACVRSDAKTGAAFSDPLLPDGTITCTLAGTAGPGAYANTGTITADGADSGEPVTDDDPSHYLAPAAAPAATIQKTTNGIDADTPATAVDVATGSTVTWQYVITNSGNVGLTDVALADDQEAAVSVTEPNCVRSDGKTGATFTDALLPAGTITCTFTGTAAGGAYANTATVTADGPGGPITPVDDPSHYTGLASSIDVEKTTNGVQADLAADAVDLVEGDPVSWVYLITNDGEEALSGVALTDDREAGVSVVEPNCVRSDGKTGAAFADPLLPSGTITCTFTGTAATGLYANTATASGTGVDTGATPADQDPSHYLAAAAAPSLSIEKATNGIDADIPGSGPIVEVGSTVTWTYVIANSGNVAISEVALTDDQEASVGVAEANCSRSDGKTGAAFADDLLPGDTITCTFDGVAARGAYANTATATGTGPDGPVTPAEDDSHHTGAIVSIDVQKATNGVQADAVADAVAVTIGDPVTWTYVITNDGDVPLSGLGLTDDQETGVGLTEPACVRSDAKTGVTFTDQLEVGDTITCTFGGTAAPGLYANTATASGAGTVVSVPVLDSDPSHYLAPSAAPALSIQKATNGIDADLATDGPPVLVGAPVTWTYVITNTGNAPVADVSLADDQEASVALVESNCVRSDAKTGAEFADDLEIGDSITCTFVGVATEGAYTNTGSANGTFGGIGVPEATDPSHHTGVRPDIGVEKFTNDVDADTAAEAVATDIGAPVTWSYVVTNTGSEPLTDVTLSDDQEPTVALVEPECGRSDGKTGVTFADALEPGDTIQCVFTGIAAAGLYTNTATAIGTGTLTGEPATPANDPSHYLAPDAAPSVSLEKATNGVDADTALEGPTVLVGEAVTWTYTIVNTGNTPLSDLSLSDDVEPTVGLIEPNCVRSDGLTGSDFSDDLPMGASIVCTFTGIATEGAYANIGTVTATPVGDGSGAPLAPVSDPSHHTGANAGLSLEKSTNGVDADTAAEAADVVAGDEVTWTYLITNTGDVDLVDVTLADDREPTVALDTDRCTRSDAEAIDAPLPPGETVTCTHLGVAVAGLYTNTATATANPDADGDGDADVGTPGLEVADPSNYLAPEPGPAIDVEKATNGVDADTAADAVELTAGDEVIWTYLITNTGDVDLVDVTLADDREPTVAIDAARCTRSDAEAIDAPLPPGETITCTHLGEVVEGDYVNVATVTGQAVTGSTDVPVGPVDDSDPSHHLGSPPGTVDLVIDKEPVARDRIDLIWELGVTNAGTAVAEPPIVVQDDLPPTMVFDRLEENGWNCTVDGTVVRCEWEGPLEPGERVWFRLHVDLLTEDAPVTNEAIVEIRGREVVLDNNTATASSTGTVTPISTAGGTGQGTGNNLPVTPISLDDAAPPFAPSSSLPQTGLSGLQSTSAGLLLTGTGILLLVAAAPGVMPEPTRAPNPGAGRLLSIKPAARQRRPRK